MALKLIGLCGLAGSGKSTVARTLVKNHGFIRRPMAYPLKAMIGALGIGPELLDGDAKVKEVPMEMFNGRTLREAMQTLGTEWGRAQFGDNFWVNMWMRNRPPTDTVCDDVRFPNEADMIRSLGGKVVRVLRPGAGSSVNATHASERVDLLQHDTVILNVGTPDDLVARVKELIATL